MPTTIPKKDKDKNTTTLVLPSGIAIRVNKVSSIEDVKKKHRKVPVSAFKFHEKIKKCNTETNRELICKKMVL